MGRPDRGDPALSLRNSLLVSDDSGVVSHPTGAVRAAFPSTSGNHATPERGKMSTGNLPPAFIHAPMKPTTHQL